eukprot:gene3943-14020_t
MDFDFVLPPDSASKAQHDRVLDKNLLDSLRSFFNTSLSEIFEDGTTVRPRSTSCPRSVGVAAARRQIAKGDPGGGPDPAVAPSSAARPRQLRSRPSQNERGAAKPKLVVSRGKQQPSLVVGSPIDELKPVKTQMSSHPQRDLRRSETKFESPVRHRHGSRQSSEQGALSSTTSSLPESPSSPGAVMTDVLSSVVNSFSTIGAKATNLLNTLDANFDQMFNVKVFDVKGHVVHSFSTIRAKATNLLNTLDANFDQMFNVDDFDADGHVVHSFSTIRAKATNLLNTLDANFDQMFNVDDFDADGHVVHSFSTIGAKATNLLNTLDANFDLMFNVANNFSTIGAKATNLLNTLDANFDQMFNVDGFDGDGHVVHSFSTIGAKATNLLNTLDANFDQMFNVVHSFSTIGAKATNLLNTLDANFDQMFNVEGFDADGHVVNSFSTIGAKATNLLNTLDANFDQMFNVEGFDANGHVDMLLTEAQHSQLQQELHKQEQKQTHLMVPTASETMTRETRQRAEPLPKADAPWSPDNDTAVDRAIGANKRMENQKRQKAKVAALSPSMINVPINRAIGANKRMENQKRQKAKVAALSPSMMYPEGHAKVNVPINRKHGEKQTGRKECNAAQPGPTTPTPHHALNGDACSPGSEQDFPRDQASRNRKIRIITPAGASQEARLQSETSHLRSENELLVSRIATLAAENERLRSDPVDLAVTCQLKKVLAEKAQLVEENAMLMRENRSLHELLAFTTDYQGLLEGSPVPSNGLPASLDGVSARMHYTTGEGVTDGLPPLTPAANGSLSDETLALDSYYSNFLPLSTSACGWDFMEMDMDMGDGSLPVQGGALGSAVQADDRSAGSTGSGQGSASESAGTATECGIRSNLAAEWDIHGAAGSIVITPRVITPRHPSRLGSSEASRSLDGGHVITPHVITPRDPSHLGNSEASRSLDSGSVITPVLGIYCPVICPFGSSEASRSLDGGSVITPCDPSHLGSSGASRSPVGGSHDDEDSMRSRASSTGGDQGTIDEAWVELDCTTSSTSYRPARGPAASESMHIPAAIQGSSPSSLPSSPNVNSYVMLSALDDVIDCKH